MKFYSSFGNKVKRRRGGDRWALIPTPFSSQEMGENPFVKNVCGSFIWIQWIISMLKNFKPSTFESYFWISSFLESTLRNYARKPSEKNTLDRIFFKFYNLHYKHFKNILLSLNCPFKCYFPFSAISCFCIYIYFY